MLSAASAPTTGAGVERDVAFYSEGLRLAGNLHVPRDLAPGERRPGIVLCHGFGGVKDLILPAIADAFVAAGYVVLRFDYRGFGKSEGPKWRLIPLEQVEDARNAVTMLQQQPEVDWARIGLYGTSFGGAVATHASAIDKRVVCTVVAVPVANGERWMMRLRRNWEWIAFQNLLVEERERRVRTGESSFVSSDQIMLPDPDSDHWHQTVISQFPEREYRLPLESAEAILEFKPEEVVGRIAPRPIMFITIPDDNLVPTDEARSLYVAAGEPKSLVVLPPGPKHHDIYAGDPFRQVMGHALAWFGKHMPPLASEAADAPRGRHA